MVIKGPRDSSPRCDIDNETRGDLKARGQKRELTDSLVTPRPKISSLLKDIFALRLVHIKVDSQPWSSAAVTMLWVAVAYLFLHRILVQDPFS
jgi:hypothetical protein